MYYTWYVNHKLYNHSCRVYIPAYGAYYLWLNPMCLAQLHPQVMANISDHDIAGLEEHLWDAELMILTSFRCPSTLW